MSVQINITTSEEAIDVTTGNITEVNISDPSGYSETDIRDIVDALVEAGSNLSWTYDKNAGTLTINTTALNQEEVDDFVATMVQVGNALNKTRDDAANQITIAVDESAISLANLGTKNHGDLDGITSNDHHTKTPDPTAGTGITDEGTNQFGLNIVLSGQVTLASGKAVVDTTLSETDATFMLALGIDDPNADCELAGRVFWDDAAGTYKIKILEQNTSVGNPTVNYDVVRVR